MKKTRLAGIYDSLKAKDIDSALLNLKVIVEQAKSPDDLKSEWQSVLYIREEERKLAKPIPEPNPEIVKKKIGRKKK